MVEFTERGNLPNDYGTTDIYANGDGSIYLWLPDGIYHFMANGRACATRIKDGAGPTGVTVNGEEAAYGPANPATAGWSFDATNRTVTLSGAGAFTLAGVNVMGGVGIAVVPGVTNTVTLSNLTLRATANQQCAFALGTNANVSLVLTGTNTLASGFDRAGLEVAEGQTLSVTNAPGDAAGSLTVTGGGLSAGIGGGNCGDGGNVWIYSGTITAIGGGCGAGIGGGFGKGGTVTINGGTVITQGTYGGAGIGGGYNGAGGTVTINGGTVTATGGDGAAGIGGGGYNSAGKGGTVTISGGTVAATGTGGATDIGPGAKASDSGANTFTGGSIRLANDTIALVPSNGTERVWCVTFPGFAPDAAPAIEGLPEGYGTNDLFAGENGTLYLWLPNGEYVFVVNGVPYVATVADASTAATTQHFSITGFTLADDTATFTLASRLPADLFNNWVATAVFEVQFCTNLTEAAWTTLPGTVRDGMTLTVPFTTTNTPRAFLRVLAQ
jgi:hypothetical protein